ncbi:hypothetical protein RhiirA5_411948 [Rhizophagus irregularis]|uniref:Uncharacterized protein n=1 Tax=Rhizophagus irregularis TaxID=588596 RepID=A0A2I1EAM9_9GLOM|nr:hypothetical protein RhiirA5_411948 [Rhizophagus irregularis]PKC76122.1 hypothetical protein RhiirA1_528204 [Rhizophagus irregularis]PKK70998.1 hypothetical protein RhiirC2_778976 [Rhizophagus irregularis]PKY19162.1 hypothetical protein RhiirB3_432165 [Rhizophagus irregularis]CAB4373866.1 unnamed protein product [Rhizophagus irregularis]
MELSEIENSPDEVSMRPLERQRLLQKPRESQTEEDVVEYINEARVDIFNKKENIIPTKFIPHFNEIPTREEFEEYEANNKKMATRLASEDNTKRVELDKPEGRPKKFRVTDKKA